MHAGSQARGNPKPEQRMHAAPRTEHAECFDVCRAHQAQHEKGKKADQPDQHAEQCLKWRDSEWIRVEKCTGEPDDQPRQDERIRNTSKSDIAGRNKRRPDQECPAENRMCHRATARRKCRREQIAEAINSLPNQNDFHDVKKSF